MRKTDERLCFAGLLWLRIFMGLGMAYHGYGKLFGGRREQFIEAVGAMGMPLPEVLAWAAMITEFLGGVLIVIGFKTRFAAVFIAVTMGVAAFITHGADPFAKKELALAYLVMAIMFIISGPGKYSLDGR